MNAFFYDELLPELQQIVRSWTLDGTRALLGLTCKAEVNVFQVHCGLLFRATMSMFTRSAWKADDPDTRMRLSLERMRGRPSEGFMNEDRIPWLPRALATEGLFGLYANTCRRSFQLMHNVPYTATTTTEYRFCDASPGGRIDASAILDRIRRDAEWAAYAGHGAAMLKWCLTARIRRRSDGQSVPITSILYTVASSSTIHKAVAATGDSDGLRLLFAHSQITDMTRAQIVASAICYGQSAIVDEYSQRHGEGIWRNILVENGFYGERSHLTSKLYEGVILASPAGVTQWLAKMDALFVKLDGAVSEFGYFHYIDTLLFMASYGSWADGYYDSQAEIGDRIAELLWHAYARSWFMPAASDGHVYKNLLHSLIEKASSAVPPGHTNVYEDIRIAFAARCADPPK